MRCVKYIRYGIALIFALCSVYLLITNFYLLVNNGDKDATYSVATRYDCDYNALWYVPDVGYFIKYLGIANGESVEYTYDEAFQTREEAEEYSNANPILSVVGYETMSGGVTYLRDNVEYTVNDYYASVERRSIAGIILSFTLLALVGIIIYWPSKDGCVAECSIS